MIDHDVLVARAAMEGHDLGCHACGWTGVILRTMHRPFSVYTKKRALRGEIPMVGECPQCGLHDEVDNFKVRETDINF